VRTEIVLSKITFRFRQHKIVAPSFKTLLHSVLNISGSRNNHGRGPFGEAGLPAEVTTYPERGFRQVTLSWNVIQLLC
jgi:hypothetical protein